VPELQLDEPGLASCYAAAAQGISVSSWIFLGAGAASARTGSASTARRIPSTLFVAKAPSASSGHTLEAGSLPSAMVSHVSGILNLFTVDSWSKGI
jgi:hypothetical protein